jgi:aminopeptidase
MDAASVALTGPVAPHIMDDVDPARVGRDMLPRVKESAETLSKRAINWTVAPGPTAGWAKLVHPDLDPDAALARLWEEIAHILRLDEPDPVAAWVERMEKLEHVARTLDELALDAVRLEGPGTDLTVGLLRSSRWIAARMANRNGVVHAANLPTEEVFTSPDPARVEGTVRATKPLVTAGALITGLEVRFEGGRAVDITAEHNADTLRTLAARDEGACRLGEVALVDRESRIGRLGTVFYDTLLDENAASHIALGQGFTFAVAEPEEDRPNRSEIHIDFMIGSDAVDVTGLGRDGTEVPLLRDGAWQI